MKTKEYQMLTAKKLKNQGYKQSQIAEQLGVTDRTVRNYLSKPAEPIERAIRQSKLDSFKPFINSIINDEPYYNCEVILDRLIKQGYTGKISILRAYVAKLRKKVIAEAVIRFETEPGRQAQVDWKEYRRTRPDGTKEKRYVFTMIMGYSRKPFYKFTTSMKQSVLLACHEEAFEYFGGVPHEILYDNMKTAFICSPEGKWLPNKRLLAFANHYGFVPLRCKVRRPQTKGKVERTIGYLDTNFWPRVKDSIWELDALNEAVTKWCDLICQKELREFKQTRQERFEHENKYLKPLVEIQYDYRDVHELLVNRESLITFETNRYSVSPEYIGDSLTLKVNPMNMLGEVFVGKLSIRQFKLEKSGSRKKLITPEDKEAIMKIWLKQQERRSVKEKQRKINKKAAVEVETCSPAIYDEFSDDGSVA